jgi:hypothetical protein
LELIEQADFAGFPPRLPGQAIFYPVLNFAYASQIASTWNVRDSGYGAVTSFEVPRELLDRYEVHTVGGAVHEEYWIPAEHLAEFNANSIGRIEVIAEYWPESGAAAAGLPAATD